MLSEASQAQQHKGHCECPLIIIQTILWKTGHAQGEVTYRRGRVKEES
jgi:hypothetical protein